MKRSQILASMAVHSAALFFVANLIGCSTVALNVPGPLIESPEIATSEGKFEFGFGADESSRYVYTEDASRRPPTLTNPELQTGNYLFGRTGYVPFEWLEIGVRLMPGSTDSFFYGGAGATARLQLIGSGPAPGIKFAVYGGAIQTTMSSSGDQNGTLGAGGYNWKANAKATVLTGGASLGYRFEGSNVLLFVAGAYADQSLSGSINHDLSQNGLSPATSYQLTEVKGNSRTAAIGMRIGRKIQFGVDARRVMRSWPGMSSPETRGGGETAYNMYGLSMYFAM